jgi:hypothetical protein
MNLEIGKGFSAALPEAPPQMELRPLGFGEIFDRAITLYIRNFVPFFGIVLVLIVPLAIVQYIVDSSQAAQINDFIRILTHPHAKPATPGMFFSPQQLVGLGIDLLVFYLLYPFVLNAVAVGVARLYRGRPVEFTACYAAVLKRWASILIMLLLDIFVILAWYAATVVALVFGVVIAAALLHAFVLLGIVAVVADVVIFFAVVLLFLVLFIALSFAMYAVVIEESSPIQALGTGFVRVFTRSEFWRAVLFALAATAVQLGAGLMIGVFAGIAVLLHWVVLESVLKTLLNAALIPFSAILIAIYYFDVRIRREGFDLEAELDRLSTGTLVA